MFSLMRRCPNLACCSILLFSLVLRSSPARAQDDTQPVWGWTTAHKVFDRYRFDEPWQRFKATLKGEPKTAEQHLLAARAARRSGEIEAAEKHLKEAERLKVAPKALQLDRWLLQVQTGDLDEAEAPLKKMLAKEPPQAALILEALAVGYAASLRLKAALAAANQLIDADAKNSAAYRVRGWLTERTGNLVDAEKDYRRALELDPELDSARLSLADVLYQTSRARDAARLFEGVAKRRPDDPRILLGLAKCQEDLGKSAEARALLEKLLAKHPKHGESLILRGKLDIQEGNAGEAEKWLRLAVKSDPYDRQAIHTLYLCLNLRGNEKEAQQLLPKLKQIEADIERLMEITSKEMDAKPRDVGLHHEIGAILLRSGQEQTGVVWLKRTLKLDPKHRPTHKLLAEYYEKTGDKKRAAEHRKLAEPE